MKKILLLINLFSISFLLSYLYEKMYVVVTNTQLSHPIKVNSFNVFLHIIVTNTISLGLLYTTTYFGIIIPIAFFIANGIKIGIIFSHLTIVEGAVLILPHGVIEFFAYFLLVKYVFDARDKKYHIIVFLCHSLF
ncbi:stage II sporulation protein M [Companilactobacillus nodensis]|uniref:stage II sporulation protein M n=1 Tax=Companilactobacillus nodensis TaxID=460870 RepID=UPI0004680094|nr:stage II sporulation protein M [Companilactobacillus nodensis]